MIMTDASMSNTGCIIKHSHHIHHVSCAALCIQNGLDQSMFELLFLNSKRLQYGNLPSPNDAQNTEFFEDHPKFS